MSKKKIEPIKPFIIKIALRPSVMDGATVVTKVQTLSPRQQMFTFVGGTPKRISSLLSTLVDSIVKADGYQERFTDLEAATSDDPFDVCNNGAISIEANFDGTGFFVHASFPPDEGSVEVLLIEKGAPASWIALSAFLNDPTRTIDSIADGLRSETE